MAKGGFPGGMGGMGGGNMQQLMMKAQKMQQDVARAQAELNEREFSASSGGGPSTKPARAAGSLSINGRYGLMSRTGVPSSRSTPPKVSTTPLLVSIASSSTSDNPSALGRKGLRLANTPTR